MQSFELNKYKVALLAIKLPWEKKISLGCARSRHQGLKFYEVEGVFKVISGKILKNLEKISLSTFKFL